MATVASAELFAEFLPQSSHRILGDTFNVGLRNLRNERGSDISAEVTGVTVTVYDSSDAVTLAANALLLSGTTRMKGTFRLTTGSGKIITAAGTYRLVYKATLLDTRTQEFQQYVEVRANPY